MKQLLKQYAAYNLWANKKLLGRISEFAEELCTREIPSSFTSINKTILHLWDVEQIWWQRLNLAEHVIWPSSAFKGTSQELFSQLLSSSQQWVQWVEKANDVNLEHVFAYQNSKREQFKQPVYEVLQHLFNHQTYHRGQVITMLHTLKVEKIPATDFILFCRSKVKIV